MPITPRSARALRVVIAVAVALLSFAAPARASLTFVSAWGFEGTADGQFRDPYDAAVDAAGNVYVVDRQNDRIQKFSASGAFLDKWGSSGTGDGQFLGPTGIAVDAVGNVYVADISRDDVQKFTANGTFVARIGTSGTGDGQFRNPSDVAVAADGAVYVVDRANNRVQKLRRSKFVPNQFVLLAKWGATGSGNGQFNGPWGVALDPAGDVYVTDTFNDRVQRFDSAGTFVAKWGVRGYGLAIAPPGLATVAAIDRVSRFTTAGAAVDAFGSAGTGPGQFNAAAGVAATSTGDVYVADTGNNRVQRLRGTDPPGGGGAGGQGAADTVDPVLGRLAARPARFRVGSRSRRGTVIRYRLSEDATVELAFSRADAGRRERGRCRRPSRSNASGRACTRYAAAGRLLTQGKPGANRLWFSGRLDRRHSLRSGAHRLSAFATDPAGNRSRRRTLRVVVVRR